MTDVVEFPGDWECRQVGRDGSVTSVRKAPRKIINDDALRNMYDACANIILPHVASVDSSYAELHTDYGPPNLFLSHVWSSKQQGKTGAQWAIWPRGQARVLVC